MPKIKVVINGVLGQMGQTLYAALTASEEFDVVGGCTRNTTKEQSSKLPDLQMGDDLDILVQKVKPDVLVDFTNKDGLLESVQVAIKNRINLVSGSTGLAKEERQKVISSLESCTIGGVIANNFAVGAVVLSELVKKTARYFDHVDIHETHHMGKIDAPSGTAISLAETASKAMKKPQNITANTNSADSSLGAVYSGIPIHSSRLPGKLAENTVTFGAEGQTLSISHQTIDRTCFMPGVMLAIKHAIGTNKVLDSIEELVLN